MNGKQAKEDWIKLFQQAAIEQDPQKLLDLTREICRLLDEKGKNSRTRAPDRVHEVLLYGRSGPIIPERATLSAELQGPPNVSGRCSNNVVPIDYLWSTQMRQRR